MNYRNMFLKYGFRQQADGEGNDTGGGRTAQFTQADVDAAVARAVAEQVAGLKAKNAEVIGDNKKLKEQLAQFDGVDVKTMKAVLQNFADTEEAKLIAEGKIDEVLGKRTERMKEAHSKELQTLQEQLEAADARAGRFTARVLGDAVRAAGLDAGICKTAFDDAVFRAQTLFDVDDEGSPTAKDGVFGKDGRPLTLKEWFDGMKETAPHWFAQPTGAGAAGAQNTAAAVRNPFKKETFNLTEQGRLLRENPELYRSLAAQAGVRV